MVLPTIFRRLAIAVALISSAAAQSLYEGQQLRAQGHCAEARDVFSAALRIADRAQPNSRLAAIPLNELGKTETCLENYAAAEKYYNRAFAILSGGADDDPVAVTVTRNLAELYMLERRPAEAEILLHRVVAALGTDRAAMAMAYSDLAVAAAMQQHRHKAETLLRQSLTLFEAKSADNPLLLGTLNPLAALLCTEHRYTEAVDVAEQARQIVRSNATSIAPADAASVMDILSRAYAGSSRPKDAESSARQAIDIVEAAYGPQHPWLATYLKQYAAVLKQEGQNKQAKEITKRASGLATEPARGAGGYTVSVNALRGF